jgi:DNA-directed RNA polymerase subunit E'/Rpb7
MAKADMDKTSSLERTITLEKTITLSPKYLNENYMDSIKNEIKEKYVGKCDEKNGYIISLKENSIIVLRNYISSAGNGIFFKVRFNVQTIKPKVGKEYQGKVILILNEYLFVMTLGLMKILIPIKNAPGYKMINGQFRKDDKVISKGDIVNVKINVLKYENKDYQIIGSLKE